MFIEETYFPVIREILGAFLLKSQEQDAHFLALVFNIKAIRTETEIMHMKMGKDKENGKRLF